MAKCLVARYVLNARQSEIFKENSLKGCFQLILEGSSGILSFMFFLRSSDICPITMSMYLIEPCCCLKLGKWYCCDYPIVHLLRIDRSYWLGDFPDQIWFKGFFSWALQCRFEYGFSLLIYLIILQILCIFLSHNFSHLK